MMELSTEALQHKAREAIATVSFIPLVSLPDHTISARVFTALSKLL
ncbi:hypothetical protein [Fischerella sp. PCC 9605]|nr:hypothetical protein [Fischerella sp. PCC 9605]